MSTNTQLGCASRHNGPRRTTSYQGSSQQRVVICHKCYDRGHFASDCALPVRQKQKILETSVSFNEKDKARVSNFYNLLGNGNETVTLWNTISGGVCSFPTGLIESILSAVRRWALQSCCPFSSYGFFSGSRTRSSWTSRTV